MVSERTRRAVLGAALGTGVAATAVPTVRGYLRQFAPLSGGVWDAATRDVGGTVDSPYGDATVRRDDWGVPHVEADGEASLSFAVGYVHGVERLFQMDLLRRQMRGQLSELAGQATVDSDEFHRRMDFAAAAEANLELAAGTETEAVLEAYVGGVNAARERETLPLEFQLLEYEPDPWTPADVMLVEKQISWVLTGGFGPLRRAAVEDALDAETTDRLYPRVMDHDAPILRERERTSAERSSGGGASGAKRTASVRPTGRSGTGDHRVGRALADWTSRFESPPGIGSNSWVVSGEHTESGSPIVANDPHLSLIAPPVWFEQHLECPAFSVRGVAFPGAPFVVIGENHAGAWGFTNVGADVTDHYTYETDGERYRYGDEWRSFETDEQTIPVDGAEDRTITTRKTVHGPVLEREGQEVAVAWTGLAACGTFDAIRAYAHSDGIDDVLAATRSFDAPTQNLVYADREGSTLYRATGRIPIRRTDGEVVPGDRVFDGSAREGEWEGFEPYGVPSWEGFVPFEEMPAVVNPDYVATANQRVIDDPGFYLSASYAPPFRGARAYELLDDLVADGPVDPEDMRVMQRDVLDRRGQLLVPGVRAVAEGGRLDSDRAAELVADLEDWDFRMDADSRGALAFAHLLDAFREVVFEEPLADAGLDAAYAPNDWVLLTLPGDDPWFDRDGVPDRGDALAEAVERAVERIDETGHETYGDRNRLGIGHPFGVGFLGYDEVAADGSPGTLRNVRVESNAGSSWRMVVPMDGESRAVLPGGNSGDYFSPHYADQLPLWVDGAYRSMEREHAGDAFYEFVGGGES